LNPFSVVHFVSVQQTTNAEINGLKREEEPLSKAIHPSYTKQQFQGQDVFKKQTST
jgi:hypothetical protein